MHGKGTFTHALGFTLKGIFVNNLYEYTFNHKCFFVSPFETKEQHKLFAEKAIASQEFKAREELREAQKVRIHRAGCIQDLCDIIDFVKSNNRTPMLVSSYESQITNKSVAVALQQDGSHRIYQLYLRDLTMECEHKRYKIRPEFLEEKYHFNDSLLHPMIVGDKPGQIMLNFDQTRIESTEFKNRGKIDSNIEVAAK